jgi:hypothetical protein
MSTRDLLFESVVRDAENSLPKRARLKGAARRGEYDTALKAVTHSA